MIGEYPIPFDNSTIAWESVGAAARFLMPAIEATGGTHTMLDILGQWVTDKGHLWLGERSACFTEIVEYPRQKHMHVFLAGGDLEEIKEWQRPGGPLERWAFQDHDCDKLSFCGREGFIRSMDNWTRQMVHCVRSKPDGVR